MIFVLLTDENANLHHTHKTPNIYSETMRLEKVHFEGNKSEMNQFHFVAINKTKSSPVVQFYERKSFI